MSGGGTNTVSSTVPSQLVPYYQTALGQGANLLSSPGPQYYPGQQVAPLNPLQESALTGIYGNAMSPTASQQAQGTDMALSSGMLMNPSMNPYLQGTFNQAADQVQNQVASQFAGAGRNIIGSAPVQSDEMNNLATQLYGGAYQQGVNSTLQASALAPSIDAGTYQPYNALLSAGSGLQNQTQNLINSNMNAWNYNQQLPYNQLSWYSGLLGANAAPFRSSSSNTAGNPFQSAIGAGLLGSSLYSSLGGAGAAAGMSAADIAAGTAASDAAAAGVGSIAADAGTAAAFA